jgi:hypothetical protein
MSVFSALADGVRRVVHAPALILGLWVAYLILPAPIALDFAHTDIALLEASAIDPMPALVMLLRDRDMAMHGLLATFLLGGTMDRLARDRATATFGFFGACGTFFFRFLRLDVVAAAAYLVVFLLAYLGTMPGNAVSIVLGVLLLLVSVVFDFARVRMVVEDRRSAFGALISGARFVARNPVSAIALAVLNVILAGGAWWLGATFAIGATAAIYAYLLARAVLRLMFMASTIALFQSRLAHAGYVARRIATWPESPAADAVLPR